MGKVVSNDWGKSEAKGVSDVGRGLGASEGLAALLRSVFGSALSDHSALYCSLPISSGRRYQRWIESLPDKVADVDHAASLYPNDHQRLVVRPNIEHARQVVERLRRSTTRPVIDPSGVPGINGWLQSDWIDFWESIIGRFVIGVVFVEDWQYSFGCVREYLYALRNRIPTFAEDGQPLGAPRAAALIREAVEEIERLTGRPRGLVSTLIEIEKLESNGAPTGSSLTFLL